jgi:biotin carboxyl carrier protein
MRMFKVVVNGNEYEVAVEEIKGEGGSPMAPAPAAPKPAASRPAPAPAAPKPAAKPSGGGGEGTVVAQMPGTIIDIDVNVGDQVVRGQKLLVLEAMKMENEIVAPHDGTVSEICVTAGALVNAGDALVILG